VVTGRRLWSHETPRDTSQIYAIPTLRQYALNANIFVWSYKTPHPEVSSLEIRDIRTGEILLQVDGLAPIVHRGGPENRTGNSHAGIWVHPRRNLIFCILGQQTPKRMGIICADTGNWVAIAELPVTQLRECPTCHGPASRFNTNILPHGPFRVNSLFGCVMFEESAPKDPDSLENFYIREYNFVPFCSRYPCPIPEHAPIYTFKLPPQEELQTKDIKDILGAPSLLLEKIEVFNIDHYFQIEHETEMNELMPFGFGRRPYVTINPTTKVVCRLAFDHDNEVNLLHVNLKLEPEMDVLTEHKSTFYSPQPTTIKKFVTRPQRYLQYVQGKKWVKCRFANMKVQALNDKYHVYSTKKAVILLMYEPKW
jgi:hypothetical protein